MTMTPAERHDWLVERGFDRFCETFTRLAKYEMAGGRLPGMVLPSKTELRKFFHKTNPSYWATLGVTDPLEAHSQLQQFERSEEA